MNIAQSQSDTSSSVPGRLGGSGLITFCCFFCKSLEMDHSIGRHKTIASYDLAMQNNYAHPPRISSQSYHKSMLGDKKDLMITRINRGQVCISWSYNKYVASLPA